MIKNEKTWGIGALLAGLAASLCCLGPLLFSALGLGIFGLSTFFDRARPFLLVFMAISLGFGFYFAYRKKELRCEDGTCTKVPATTKANKVILWIIALLAVIFYLVPYFL